MMSLNLAKVNLPHRLSIPFHSFNIY